MGDVEAFRGELQMQVVCYLATASTPRIAPLLCAPAAAGVLARSENPVDAHEILL